MASIRMWSSESLVARSQMIEQGHPSLAASSLVLARLRGSISPCGSDCEPAALSSVDKIENVGRRLEPLRTAPGVGTGPFRPLWSLLELRVVPFDWNQRFATLVVRARVCGRLRNHGPPRPMEVPMTMHSDHHVTDVEDVAFDTTMKIVGGIMGLVVIAGMALWYIYS